MDQGEGDYEEEEEEEPARPAEAPKVPKAAKSLLCVLRSCPCFRSRRPRVHVSPSLIQRRRPLRSLRALSAQCRVRFCPSGSGRFRVKGARGGFFHCPKIALRLHFSMSTSPVGAQT